MFSLLALTCAEQNELLAPLAGNCPPADLTVQADFNLDTYISKDWWIQEQMVIKYLPEDEFNCVRAHYSKGVNRFAKFLGYQVQVENYAKLMVGPCFLPIWKQVTAGCAPRCTPKSST